MSFALEMQTEPSPGGDGRAAPATQMNRG